jgi:hypothetical protein
MQHRKASATRIGKNIHTAKNCKQATTPGRIPKEILPFVSRTCEARGRTLICNLAKRKEAV